MRKVLGLALLIVVVFYVGKREGKSIAYLEMELQESKRMTVTEKVVENNVEEVKDKASNWLATVLSK